MHQHIISALWYLSRGCLATALFLTVSAVATAEVRVQVEFQNGDRLTGTFVSANRQEVSFRPYSKGIADADVAVKWDADHVVILHLSNIGGDTGSIYLAADGTSQRIAALNRGELRFKTADVAQPDGAGSSLHLKLTGVTTRSSAKAPAIDVYSRIAAISSTPVVSQAPAVTSDATAAPKVQTITALTLNAPESIVQASQSSQTFGGLGVQDFYFGDDNHLSIAASGSHLHTLSLHKPAITTDVFDSAVQFSHALSEKKNRRYILYTNVDWFFNSSLGVAADRSVGAGIGTPTFYTPSENLSFKTWADLRYFNERLYNGKTLNLIGSGVQGQVNYSPSDQSWFLSAGLSWKPAFNNWSAWQGYGNVTFTVPLGHHFCLGLTPADDTYVDNSPHGFRRNYLKSSAGLQIMLGTNPDQKCN
jgi:hypothetical protein